MLRHVNRTGDPIGDRQVYYLYVTLDSLLSVQQNKLTCELSCSDDSLNVVVIFLARPLASENPKENKLISAMSA